MDACNYDLDACDNDAKDWKRHRMYCESKSKYECYKKDLWKLEDPKMVGFENHKHPFVVSGRKKNIEGATYFEVCVYW